MTTFFDSQPLSSSAIPSLEELRARTMPPAGYEGAKVVQVGDHLVWKMTADLVDHDQVCFFDGDCRQVLTPDDPRLNTD